MRSFLVAVLGAIGVATILAAGGGTPARAVAETALIKCIDCEGRTCHSVYGPGYRSCVSPPEGCMAWDECG